MATAAMGAKLAMGLGGSSRLLQQSAARRVAGRRSVSTVVAAAPKSEDRLPVAVAGVSLATSTLAPAAHAEDAAVDTAVSSIVDIVKATGEVVKQGVSAAQTGAEYAKTAYEQVAPVVKSAYETAAPVVEQGVKTAVEAAKPALQTGLQEASKALTSSGLDPAAAKPIVETTGQAVTTAKPFLEQALTFVTTTEPVVLGEYALGLIAAYYLGPPVLKATAGLLRGYAGDVAPAAALNSLETEGNAIIVDIRSARDKEISGLPDIPNSGKLIELEYASIEDRKVRGQLRNAAELEVKVTALQIAELKRLSKGSKVFLLDRNGGDAAKAVGKALAGRGFGQVYVIKGGFQGWQSSKLRVKTGNVVSRVEVLSPGTGFAGRVRSVSPSPNSTRPVTISGTAVPNRRALPSSTGN